MRSDLTLGEYLRRLRRQRRWGLQQLAESTGLSVSHLSRIENDSAVPNADTVVKLATALDGELDRMLEMADCLPREILDRYVRRASDGDAVLRRSADTKAIDPEFPRLLVDDMDSGLRHALAGQFGLSAEDVDGLFTLLRQIGQMPPADREAVIGFLSARAQKEPTKEG